jgi:hypothetical protein
MFVAKDERHKILYLIKILILKSRGCIKIIDYNKRRTKDPLKLAGMKLNNKENIYIKKEQKLKIPIYLKNAIKDYQTDLKLQ